jgi:hypothetical protein
MGYMVPRPTSAHYATPSSQVYNRHPGSVQNGAVQTQSGGFTGENPYNIKIVCIMTFFKKNHLLSIYLINNSYLMMKMH